MVEERLTNGTRIGQLLASEVDGRSDGELSRLAVVNADPETEPTVDGAFAYAIEADGDDDDQGHGDDEGSDTESESESESESERLAEVYLQPDRVHLEFEAGHEGIVDAADRAGLRVRPKAVVPPKTLVFVENGAEVKRVIGVIETAL